MRAAHTSLGLLVLALVVVCLVARWRGDAGRIGCALIGRHAAAALLHHRVWRDNTW